LDCFNLHPYQFIVYDPEIHTLETVEKLTFIYIIVTCLSHSFGIMYVCMYKGWAIKIALAPLPLMIYCASPLAAAMIITVAALRIVLAHGSKPT
jgi:hypothetical protein